MKIRATVAVAFLVPASWAGTARADDTSLEGLLSEEVVTSVSKSAETTEAAPALTRSISAEEIRRYGMTSVDEALDFLGVGVHAQHVLGQSELTARGVGFPSDRGNHTLLLVDGHVINEPLFGDASFDQTAGIPLELIDHIELVLGPGSAMYGSNAVLAVVNVVTKSASSHEGIHAAVEGGAIGTVRSTLTFGRSFELFGKRAGLTAGLSYFGRDVATTLPVQTLGTDPFTQKPSTWGGVTRSSDRAAIPALHLRFVRDRLEISARVVVASTGDATVGGDFNHPNTGFRERRANLTVSQSFPLGKVGDLTATVYGDLYSNRHRVIVSNPTTCPPTFAGGCDYRELESSSRLGAELRANLDWLHDGRLVTSLGTTASFDRVSASSDLLEADTGTKPVELGKSIGIDHVVNLAANGQQTIRPVRWLDLSAGARVDWRDIHDSDGADQKFTPVLTPRLAIGARPWSGATAKLIYAEAFRAPNPFELDAQSPTLVASSHLNPERASSIEAIVEQRIDAHRITFGVFRTKYRGIINRLLLSPAETNAAIAGGRTDLAPVGVPVFQYRSDDNIDAHGFNVAFDGAGLQRKLRFGASFTGTVTRVDGAERALIAPQVFGNARVSYDLGSRLPTAAMAASFAGNSAVDRAYDAGFSRNITAPPSLELRATLTGEVPFVKGLSYRMIVAHQFHPTTPFSVGPVIRAQPGFDAPLLAPSQPWNAMLGLQYDFGR